MITFVVSEGGLLRQGERFCNQFKVQLAIEAVKVFRNSAKTPLSVTKNQ
jgi:hypothetical protein